MAEPIEHSGLPNGARLIQAAPLNARALTYEFPADRLIAVFDGDVALEPSCYEVSNVNQQVQLKRPPAFEIKFLVAPARN